MSERRFARWPVAALAVVALLAWSRPARAERVDPWFGRDKILHLGASAGLSAAGYTIGSFAGASRGTSLVIGGALSLAAGVGKESLDLAGYGDPSWKDLAWDGIGDVAGLALAWSTDLLLRGVSAEHPLFLAPELTSRSASLSLRFAF